MKDSNTAPSPNTPAPNVSRGKVAVPKANACATAKNAEPKKSVVPEVVAAPVTSPKIEAQAPAPTTLAAPKPEAATPQTEIAAVVAPALVTPPKVLTPNVMQSKTSASGKAPVARSAAPNAVVASDAAPKPKATVSKAASNANATVVSAPVAARKRTLPRFRPLALFAALAALILTTAGGVAVGSYSNWSNSQVIAPKVHIAGEPIGGMTREQAIARLNQRFGKLAFTLQTDDKNIVLGLSDIGGKPSIEPTVDKAFAIGRSGSLLNNFTRVFGSEVKSRTFILPIEWNRGALTSRLQIVNKQYARPAVDARLVTVSGGVPRVTGEATGRALDVSATADAVQNSYYLGVGKIPAVTHEVAPKVVAADLSGRDVKLGEYRTTYNGGVAGRSTNIHVACRAIDGTVLMPGEVLSFNGLTGERTYKKGYRMAHIFLREAGQSESQVVDGLAGGVCQVSSTLYNAVRKTNAQATDKPLGIVERNSHSLPVTYVPSGRDATVAWPSKDFKFRNDNSFPVYVRTKAGNSRLTIAIWGRVPQNQPIPISLKN